ncbi:GH3 auxin-responsive promoter family protein [Burkholderia sp. AU30198]|uniref:GH3 family domain-containing protein n=1 Tax=Burkholderia sp. AU30198 TaxID=2879627 RepID=UPI001CF198D7|nr:GH3 auxin-responsive promoter family protein [Burkholderia sp. AU30198]MCA8293644.1 GH3 auxin-responsive promoter family protein [Burkholderia sp. AU30198]
MDASVRSPADAWRTFARAAQPDVDRWQAGLEAPGDTQARRLMALLAANRDTAFGRRFGFDRIDSPAQFRERVPVHAAADFLPWLERMSQEPEPVLTAERPVFLERTSGSTARQKLIPYTPAFLRELQAAMIVWLADMYRGCPALGEGRAYWSMSPPLQAPGVTPNGIPVGSASDLDYLGDSPAAALASTLLVPPLTGDASTWRRETLRALVADEALAFISVWSPTFLTSVLRPLFDGDDADAARDLAWIDASLPADRRTALRRAIEDGDCRALWPCLAAVSCWLDGPSKHYADALRAQFPHVPWLPKGLFATEGVASIPFGTGDGCPLAIGSHYLEFVRDDGSVCDVDGLRPGDDAQVLLTTGGGLYRYALGDRVRAVGMTARTPRIAFVGRAAVSVDLVGEKFDEQIAAEALDRARGQYGEVGACIVPCVAKEGRPNYMLCVAGDIGADAADAMCAAVEAELMQAFHYAHARRLGQLGPLRVRRLGRSPARLGDLQQQAAERAGIRAGDVKPCVLVTRLPMADALLAMTNE